MPKDLPQSQSRSQSNFSLDSQTTTPFQNNSSTSRKPISVSTNPSLVIKVDRNDSSKSKEANKKTIQPSLDESESPKTPSTASTEHSSSPAGSTTDTTNKDVIIRGLKIPKRIIKDESHQQSSRDKKLKLKADNDVPLNSDRKNNRNKSTSNSSNGLKSHQNSKLKEISDENSTISTRNSAKKSIPNHDTEPNKSRGQTSSQRRSRDRRKGSESDEYSSSTSTHKRKVPLSRSVIEWSSSESEEESPVAKKKDNKISDIKPRSKSNNSTMETDKSSTLNTKTREAATADLKVYHATSRIGSSETLGQVPPRHDFSPADPKINIDGASPRIPKVMVVDQSIPKTETKSTFPSVTDVYGNHAQSYR